MTHSNALGSAGVSPLPHQLLRALLGSIVVIALSFTTACGPDQTKEPAEHTAESTAPTTPDTEHNCGYRKLAPSATVRAIDAPNGRNVPDAGKRTVLITTNLGELRLRLDQTAAPCTVNSWAHLANSHFYDGINCHRVSVGIVQCGDPFESGYGKPAYEYLSENLPTDQHPTYPRGVVAMAHTGNGQIGSQFFIMTTDADLEATYPIAGIVTGGLELIDTVVAAGHDGAFEPQPGGGHPNQQLRIETMLMR